MSTISHSQELARFLAGLDYSDIPARAIEQAKLVTLHCLAASIAANPMKQTRNVIRMAGEMGGKPEATVWGSNGAKVPVASAAFANGTIADILDWEDCSWTGHPSAGAVPAGLAIGEARRVRGKDYLTAVVAAYEGYQRIAMSAQPSRAHLASGRGWGLVSWQIFASAIAAGKLRQFNDDQMNQLFGASLYSTVVPSSRHSKGLAKSDIYHYAHGTCARNGVVAAELTDIGFDNCRDTLDGSDGFWSTVSDQVDWSWYTRDLTSRWLICETYMKHWPANMWVQTPLEIIDELHRKHDLRMDRIDRIRISPHLPFISGRYAETTRTELDAQFSIPYCLSAYLMNPSPSADWFSESMRNSAQLIEFTEKFEFIGDTRRPQDNFLLFQGGTFPKVEMEIFLSDGTCLHHAMCHPKGHPMNNFSMEEVADHFRQRSEPFLSRDRIEKIIASVAELERLDDVSTIPENCIIN